jgi:hypothetical protein
MRPTRAKRTTRTVRPPGPGRAPSDGKDNRKQRQCGREGNASHAHEPWDSKRLYCQEKSGRAATRGRGRARKIRASCAGYVMLFEVDAGAIFQISIEFPDFPSAFILFLSIIRAKVAEILSVRQAEFHLFIINELS